MKLWSCCVALAATACGGDKVTAPAPCDTYHGGIAAVSDSLPGSYTLTSLCQGVKPDLVPPAATGTVTLTATNFDASLTINAQQQPISGTYTTSGETIDVNLGVTQLTGTFSLANNTLKVSGVAGTQRLSLVATRGP